MQRSIGHLVQALESHIGQVVLGKRDVVRHALVQRIITAYEEHRGKTKPE